jgi:uncharacterized protein YdhG (YjbR/CyaY superfamily)
MVQPNAKRRSGKTPAKRSLEHKAFTQEERAAMKERAREIEGQPNESDGDGIVLAKIAEMSDGDRAMALRLHEIVMATAPELSPRTWYGMPAYAKAGKVVCFFQAAQKFKSRYATLGFSDASNLDEGAMWPIAFALEALTPTEESKIVDLLRKALDRQ